MDSVTATQSLEERAKNRQLSEEELAVLDKNNTLNSLFKRFGNEGIVKIIKRMRSTYQSEADKEYIRELIYRFVGEGSDLNWDNKKDILQKLVTCNAGQNKAVVGCIRDIFNNKKNNSNGQLELKLQCNITKEYVVLKDAIYYCCSYPEQPIKSVLGTMEEFRYRKPRNFLANNT